MQCFGPLHTGHRSPMGGQGTEVWSSADVRASDVEDNWGIDKLTVDSMCALIVGSQSSHPCFV